MFCYLDDFLATRDPAQTKDLEIPLSWVVLQHPYGKKCPVLFDPKVENKTDQIAPGEINSRKMGSAISFHFSHRINWFLVSWSFLIFPLVIFQY